MSTESSEKANNTYVKQKDKVDADMKLDARDSLFFLRGLNKFRHIIPLTKGVQSMSLFTTLHISQGSSLIWVRRNQITSR